MMKVWLVLGSSLRTCTPSSHEGDTEPCITNPISAECGLSSERVGSGQQVHHAPSTEAAALIGAANNVFGQGLRG